MSGFLCPVFCAQGNRPCFCWIMQTLPILIFFFIFLLLCVCAILYFCYPYFRFASMQAFLFSLIFLVTLTGRFPAAVSIKPYRNRTLPVNAATGSLGKPATISWYDNSHLMRWSSVKLFIKFWFLNCCNDLLDLSGFLRFYKSVCCDRCRIHPMRSVL